MLLIQLAAAALLNVSSLAVADTVPVVHYYTLVRSIPLGAPDRWDYLTYDASKRRVYLAHDTSIDVLDARSGAVLGKVPVAGANGVAIASDSGKGFAGSRRDHCVIVFDLETFAVVKRLPADEDTDGVVFDPASGRVFVMEGDPNKTLVVDARTAAVVGRISLAGAPEFAAVDGDGHLFVNIADKRAIQRISTRTLQVESTWPIAECESPHGLAIDPQSRHLFASCLNNRMLVVDAASGKVVQSLAIGAGSDAAAFDARRKRAFSSNGIDGTVTVVQEEGPGRFELLGENPTQPSARTLAVDPESGRLFLVAGERIEVDPAAANPRKRFGIRAGTVRLLFLDPRGGGVSP